VAGQSEQNTTEELNQEVRKITQRSVIRSRVVERYLFDGRRASEGDRSRGALQMNETRETVDGAYPPFP
jgi:hypothetical protein